MAFEFSQILGVRKNAEALLQNQQACFAHVR